MTHKASNKGCSWSCACFTWLTWSCRDVRSPSRCSSCPLRQGSTKDRRGCWLSRNMFERQTQAVSEVILVLPILTPFLVWSTCFPWKWHCLHPCLFLVLLIKASPEELEAHAPRQAEQHPAPTHESSVSPERHSTARPTNAARCFKTTLVNQGHSRSGDEAAEAPTPRPRSELNPREVPTCTGYSHSCPVPPKPTAMQRSWLHHTAAPTAALSDFLIAFTLTCIHYKHKIKTNWKKYTKINLEVRRDVEDRNISKGIWVAAYATIFAVLGIETHRILQASVNTT